MRLTKALLFSRPFRKVYRNFVPLKTRSSIIKVSEISDDDSLKISFKYSNSPYLNIRVTKEEQLQSVLHRMKLMIGLQKKKEEIRQMVVSKYSQNAEVIEQTQEDDPEVYLMENDDLIDDTLPNNEAWTRASLLKIGDSVFDVRYNMPSVLALSLPNYIVSNCPLRAHYILECASGSCSTFIWYRSISKTDAEKKIAEGNENVLLEDSKCWEKVSESFIYHTTDDDVGCYLKVVCIPKSDDQVGFEESVESKSVVEACAKRFPFEDRQLHTSSLCDKNSLRCMSYNVLANCYVEKRKYPYCSLKSRDNYYRKQILLKELPGYNSDIICLQEVPERNFYFDLIPVLAEIGFNGFYVRKGGRRNEGLATFFRTSKYNVLEKHEVLLNDVIKEKDFLDDLLSKVSGNLKDMSKLLIQDNAFQVLLLEQIGMPGRQMLIANTHLYSNKDMPEVRLMQAAICTYYIEHVIKIKNSKPVALIFCGDFNSLPESATYNFMKLGSYECLENAKTHGNTTDILKHNLNLDSACGIPIYTNYTDEFQGCLDYIFYSKNLLEVSEVVPMPSHEKVVEHVGLPNEYFPSDHIALVCTLKWKNC